MISSVFAPPAHPIAGSWGATSEERSPCEAHSSESSLCDLTGVGLTFLEGWRTGSTATCRAAAYAMYIAFISITSNYASPRGESAALIARVGAGRPPQNRGNWREMRYEVGQSGAEVLHSGRFWSKVGSCNGYCWQATSTTPSIPRDGSLCLHGIVITSRGARY